jgi:hypothetical protein
MIPALRSKGKVRWGLSGRAWSALLVICMPFPAKPVQAQTGTSASAAQTQTLARLTAVHDDFVKRVRSSGLACTLPPPNVKVRNVLSYGEYDRATNTVASTDWTILDAERKAPFFQMAGPGASDEAAHAAFEDTMHRSMFVHELAHWWEACHKVTPAKPLSLFQQGMQADRIAIAYWREADPALPPRVAAIAQGLIDHTPSPVPANEDVRGYFNRNYGTFDPSVQPWFGAQLYLAAYKEMPPPDLIHALALSER